MYEQRGKRLSDNLITGAVMLLAYLAVSLLAPEMDTRWKLLIALAFGGAASLASYFIRKRKKEKEDEERLPPV